MKQSIQFWFASGVALCCLAMSSPVQAQIASDTTLPNNSQVISQGKNSIITGGTRAGGNLFHSFSQFSVPTLGIAYFNNALDIQNIISRVTGSSISNIDGLIRAKGTANLFLVNPNGIIFGPNAQLRIGGSFVASTASSLKLADGSSFIAKTPETKPLLTVSLPIGLQYGASPGSITNQSQVTDSSGTLIGLQVQPGKTLALVSGDVSLDGGRITAAGGRVELGGLAGAGTVGLGINGNTLSFSFTPDSSLANVTLTNDARVSVRGSGGGNIVVNANAFNATNGGRLVAGTEGRGNGGYITVNANNFSISGVGLSGSRAGLYNQTLANASGNGGDITIKAGSLSITDGAQLSTATFGQGNADGVFVQANGPVSLADSSILNNAESGAVGNAGGISITAGSLSVTDGAQLSTSTSGQGNAGRIFVQANGPVSLANGSIISNVESGAVGNAGDILITAGSLSLTNGAQLQSIIREASGTLPGGRGNGGSVNINTRDAVTIAGANSTGIANAIFDDVRFGAVGNGGDITIKAGSLSVTEGAKLSTSTSGQGNAGSVFVQANGPVSLANGSIISNVASGGVGNAGDISITAGSLSLTNSAQLQSSIREASGTLPGGRGNGGNVNINTRDAVTIAGVNSAGYASSIFSNVGDGAVGNGGKITIKAGSLSLTDGAQLITDTSGQGNAGSVFVQANGDVSLTGNTTVIFSAVQAGAVGSGGEISVKARSLSLDDSAQLATSTGGQGNAGNIQVNATDSVSIRGGSVLQANTLARGNAGSVTIAGRDGVVPVVSFDGVGAKGLPSRAVSGVGKNSTGKGGEVNITARSLYLTNGAQLATSTLGQNLGQDAGNIRANALESISASGGSYIESNTYGQGNAGNVTIQAGGIAFDGVGSKNISSGAFSFVSQLPGFIGAHQGGDINITARSLSLTNGAELNALASGQGNAGSVNINVSNAVSFDGVGSNGLPSGATTSLNGGIGKGGDINISTGSLSLTNGAELLASTFGQGDAGNVSINAHDIVTFDGVGSNRFRSGAFTFVGSGAVGKGGDINIFSGSLFISHGAGLSSSTFGQGDAGNVNINARDAVTATGNNSTIASLVSGEVRGKGGDINISTGSLSLTNGAELLAYTSRQGDAGNIRINARDVVTFDGVDSNGASSGAFSTVKPGAVGKGGDINIDPIRLTMTNGAGVVVDSQGSGRGGNLNVQADYLTLDNNASLSATATSAEGGNIALDVPSLLLMRHNSQISATAGISGGSGNGGNIGINTNFLAAFPSENSDISANAFTGSGGNIQITAQGIFGIASQLVNTPQSDITASSTLGINGTVQINTLVIDPSRGLVVLPAQIVDASGLIAQSCPATGGQAPSKFVVTGRGGLPPTPSHTLTSDAVLTNWASLEPGENHSGSAHANNPAPESEPTQIIEAQGWVMDAHGKVILTAQPTNLTPNSPGLKPPACHGV